MTDHGPTLDNAERRRLRGIAHHLQPVVTVGDGGLSDAVLAEVERALEDHELIKVKLPAGDQGALRQALCEASGATAVQAIGRVLVLLRYNPDAKARLSNLRRFA